MGLNPWATKFVKGTQREGTEDYLSGMQDHPLHKYSFPDGRAYLEYEQAGFSDHGPVWFLALKDETGKEVPDSLWTRKQAKSVTNYLPSNLQFR